MANSTTPNNSDKESENAELASRCYEIQTSLGNLEVPEFEQLRKVGMAVRLALHIRGLDVVNYETLKLAANHYLDIPTVAIRSVVELLAEVEFVKVQSEGKTFKAIVPTVPYYETLYQVLGGVAKDSGLNEAEQLSVAMLSKLARSPQKVDSLENSLGAEVQLVRRALHVGKEGAYLRIHRSRGRDIALSPAYFSENAAFYADLVAASGPVQVSKLLDLLKLSQGMPLSIIKDRKEIAGVRLSDDEVSMLVRLAQDGAVKPPSITTEHVGEQHFLFTPTPSGPALSPTKKEIYERAMAIVASIRQGQFMPKEYAIRSPRAVLGALKSNLKLGKATTEFPQQYKKLVHLRIARIVSVRGGFSELHIIDTPENVEALSIAYDLVSAGVATETEVDLDARKALQQEQSYIESVIASGTMAKREKVELTQQQQLELEGLYL